MHLQKCADFITKDAEISNFISDNFVYIHVNYNPRMAKSKDESVVKRSAELMKRLDNAGRFGYPVFIVLDKGGKVLFFCEEVKVGHGSLPYKLIEASLFICIT